MAKTLLTRRSFTKLAAVVGAAAGFSAAPRQALAETSQPASATPEVKVVRSCCRACGKNECGVYVTVENGRAVKVEGDADTAFHSMGNCCSKSQSSIQAAYHPDRLYHPMKRTNPKGEADPGWVRITWDEAYATIAEKFAELEERYGGECMFFMGGTSRIWTQHAYAAWGQLVNSPNALTAWQICKGPRHMATEMQSEFAYSWMATTDRPRVFVQWGTATEISNYDESCRTTVDIATHGRHLHQHRPAHDEPQPRGRRAYVPYAGNRRRVGSFMDQRHHRERPVRPPVRQALDRRPLPGGGGHGAVRCNRDVAQDRLGGWSHHVHAPSEGKRPQGGWQSPCASWCGTSWPAPTRRIRCTATTPRATSPTSMRKRACGKASLMRCGTSSTTIRSPTSPSRRCLAAWLCPRPSIPRSTLCFTASSR